MVGRLRHVARFVNHGMARAVISVLSGNVLSGRRRHDGRFTVWKTHNNASVGRPPGKLCVNGSPQPPARMRWRIVRTILGLNFVSLRFGRRTMFSSSILTSGRAARARGLRFVTGSLRCNSSALVLVGCCPGLIVYAVTRLGRAVLLRTRFRRFGPCDPCMPCVARHSFPNALRTFCRRWRRRRGLVSRDLMSR